MYLSIQNTKKRWARKAAVFLAGFMIGFWLIPSAFAQNSLLYKIEGNGIKTSYLYGTFHILPQEDFVITDNITNALDKTSQIVLELDMDDPNLQAEMMGGMAMTDGSTIDKLLSESEFQKLDALLKKTVNIGAPMVNSVKPFMVAAMLYENYIEGKPASYEGWFVQQAGERKMEVLGLETATEQLNICERISYEEQAKDLAEMLNDHEKMAALFEKMIDLYKAAEIEKLYQLAVDEFDGENEAELLLDDRNKKWIPKIGNIAQEKETFFAVGAGHLGGENGVLKLLKKAGYTVTAM